MREVPFLDACDIQGGTQPPKSTFKQEPSDNYIRLLQIRDFKSDDNPVYVPRASNLKTCDESDIMIARYGASIGRILQGKSGAYNVALVKTIPNDDLIDRRYLSHFLSSPKFQNYILGLGGRAAQAGFNKKDLERTTIPLPSLDEQKRIAAILDRADALRRLRQRAIDRLDVLGKAWFDGHQKSLRGENTTLGEVCAKITDGTHQSPKWATSGVPFLFVSNIRNQEIDFETEKFISEQTYDELTRNTKVEPGDVLYTSVGSYGHAAVVPEGEKFLFQRHIAHLKPNPDLIDSYYLMYLLESPSLRHQADVGATGIAQKTVTLSLLKRMEAIIPPLSVQTELVAKLNKITERKITYHRALSSFNELFASLQSRAFRGEL
ncbi:restriction endonuclease subunit S [Pseudooceanicola batsensis]|uniref:restriction endonuclease subunit S n=1 Tax=Pseudooceanicola batsensis TaxID=314255 RepID=UPI0003250BBB|nr:restriction endonuclease subunit S [Pseudooceanicola batsensis]